MYHDLHQNTIIESCLTIVIVKISLPKVKIAVLKNLLIWATITCHKASVCLRGGETLFGRMPFEHAVSLHGASPAPLPVMALFRLNFTGE